MAVAGRSSGNQQSIAFGNIANELQRAAFNFGAMAGSAQQLYASLSVFRDLEKQLTLVNAIANGTTDSFRAMEKSVRDFALGTTFTASQSANALLLLAQAGFDTQQSMTAMTGVLTLAQATLEEVNETADLVASTLTSFALEADQAGRVSNLFAASMNQSLASLPKLAFALRQVGPVMGSMGVSIEDTTAALSELFNVGLRGEQAGTALRNVMVNIISPAGEAAKIMQTLGIQVNKADGSLRDMFDILKDIARFNLSDADLSGLFGREALAGGIALLESARSGSLEQMRDNISNTQEATRVAIEQMRSLDAQIRLAQNAVDEFRISLGEELAGTISGVLGWITDMGIAWRELDKASKAYLITATELVTVLGLVTFAGRRIVPMIAEMAMGMVSFGRAAVQSARDTATWISVWRQSSGMTLGSHMAALGTTAAAAAPAIGLVVAAIAGAGGLIWAMREARKAADEARLDEYFGDLQLNADNIRRDFSNLRQMARAGKDPEMANAFAERYRATKDIIAAGKEDLADLQTRLSDLGSVQDRLNERLMEITSQPIFKTGLGRGRNKTVFDAELIFGIPENADTVEAAKAVSNYFERQFAPVLDAVRQVSPDKVDQFRIDLLAGIQEAIDKGQSPGLVAAAASARINALVDGLLGGEEIGRTQAALEERIRKLREDLKTGEENVANAVNNTAPELAKNMFAAIQKAAVETMKAANMSEADAKAAVARAVESNRKSFEDAEKSLLDAMASGENKIDLKSLIKAYLDSLVATGQVTEADLRPLKENIEKGFSLVTKYSLDIIEKSDRKAREQLLVSRTKLAAARGDKTAEKQLRDIQSIAQLANDIASYSEDVSKAISNRLQTMGAGAGTGISDVLSGKFLSDMLTGSEEERQRARRAIDDAEVFQKEIETRVRELFAFQDFERDLVAAVGGTVVGLDTEAVFAPVIEMRKAIEGGKPEQEALATALSQLEGYFLTNIGVADNLLRTAGVPIEYLNNAQKAKLAASTIAYMNGAEMARLLSKTIQDTVKKSFEETESFLDGAILTASRLWTKAVTAVMTLKPEGETAGTVSANRVLLDQTLKELIEERRRTFKTLAETIDNENLAADVRTDNKGKGKKTKEQILAELNEFLATRNKMIVDAALELAAFGGDFNVNDFLDLRIQEIATDYAQQIAKVREEYEKMFRTHPKGTADYDRLLAMRDREIDQLELLRDKQLEYANSADFAARVAQESAQKVLDKYIEMNTYTGSFFEGLLAGMQQNRLEFQTEFEVGMQTFKELVDGITTFGMNSFSDFFSQVATGQKTMAEVLRANLAKMLMDWANYFANLALKYLADYVLRQILGLLNPGGAAGGGFFDGGLGDPMGNRFDTANGRAYNASFARGGVTSGTEYFGFSKEHKIGRRGEAGEEATMPLTRDGRGRLSVLAIGDESRQERQGNTMTYQSTMTFDLGSGGGDDEKSRFELMKKIEQRTKDVALQTIAEERRVGGLLWQSQG